MFSFFACLFNVNQTTFAAAIMEKLNLASFLSSCPSFIWILAIAIYFLFYLSYHTIHQHFDFEISSFIVMDTVTVLGSLQHKVCIMSCLLKSKNIRISCRLTSSSVSSRSLMQCFALLLNSFYHFCSLTIAIMNSCCSISRIKNIL